MGTELEENEKLRQYIQLLCDLNHQTVEMLRTGDTELLFAMNDTVETMYEIQQNSDDEVYTAIEEDSQIIYKNFNAIITMINSNEENYFFNQHFMFKCKYIKRGDIYYSNRSLVHRAEPSVS